MPASWLFLIILMHLNKLLSVAQPIRRLQMPAATEMNKRGFLLQASFPSLPFDFSLSPHPLLTCATLAKTLTNENVIFSILRALEQSRCTLQAEATFSHIYWWMKVFSVDNCPFSSRNLDKLIKNVVSNQFYIPGWLQHKKAIFAAGCQSFWAIQDKAQTLNFPHFHSYFSYNIPDNNIIINNNNNKTDKVEEIQLLIIIYSHHWALFIFEVKVKFW